RALPQRCRPQNFQGHFPGKGPWIPAPSAQEGFSVAPQRSKRRALDQHECRNNADGGKAKSAGRGGIGNEPVRRRKIMKSCSNTAAGRSVVSRALLFAGASLVLLAGLAGTTSVSAAPSDRQQVQSAIESYLKQ